MGKTTTTSQQLSRAAHRAASTPPGKLKTSFKFTDTYNILELNSEITYNHHMEQKRPN